MKIIWAKNGKNYLFGCLQKGAEEALAEALPALEAARLALDDLDKNDVTEIRSFAKPPKAVQSVCECVVVVKGIKEISWKSAKAMMSDPGFLMQLKTLDVDGITGNQVKNTQKTKKKQKKQKPKKRNNPTPTSCHLFAENNCSKNTRRKILGGKLGL